MCEEDASGSRSSRKGCRDLLDACSLGHEAGDTEILQVWHPSVQPKTRDVCGWKERTGKQKHREAAPDGWEGPLLCTPRFSHKVTLLHSHLLTYHRGDKSCSKDNIAQLVKNLPAMQETLVQVLGQEDPLEKR